MKNIPATKRIAVLAGTLLALAVTAGCGPEQPPAAETSETAATSATPAAADTPAPASETPAAAPVAAEAALLPLPGMEGQVPALTEKTTIRMQTTAGDLVIELYPQAAPNAVERFVALVESGYYDNTSISRVVPGFVAQFGINGREPHKAWRDMPFEDDPSLFALERGTLAFAKAGPNTNTTQVFINYAENNRLADPNYNFTTFGKIISGMEVVDMFVVVGEPGMGLDQDRLWDDGEAYLAEQTLKPTMITDVEVVK